MDLLGKAAGLTLNSAGFTPGTLGDCVSSPSATMCSYAAANGYNGAGLVSGAASNSVSWTFPPSVSGVTTPPSSQAAYPFLKVSIAENVGTYFLAIVNSARYLTLNVSCTCGLVQSKVAAPMVVLSPTNSGSLYSSGNAALKIVGGPQRSVQVNSSSSTAVQWSSSGLLDLSSGGPYKTVYRRQIALKPLFLRPPPAGSMFHSVPMDAPITIIRARNLVPATIRRGSLSGVAIRLPFFFLVSIT